MKILNNKYLKIFLLLIAVFVISDFSIKNVFIAQSPKLNPFFAQNMIAKINNLWSKTISFIAFKNVPTQSPAPSSVVAFNSNNVPKNVVEALSAPLTKVSQGVYAGEKNGIKVFKIKLGELEYLEYTFTVNGKEVKIKVPKGQKPPSQKIVNALYK